MLRVFFDFRYIALREIIESDLLNFSHNAKLQNCLNTATDLTEVLNGAFLLDHFVNRYIDVYIERFTVKAWKI